MLCCTLAHAVFDHPSGADAAQYFRNKISGRYDLDDPSVLAERLTKELGSMGNVSTATDNPRQKESQTLRGGAQKPLSDSIFATFRCWTCCLASEHGQPEREETARHGGRGYEETDLSVQATTSLGTQRVSYSSGASYEISDPIGRTTVESTDSLAPPGLPPTYGIRPRGSRSELSRSAERNSALNQSLYGDVAPSLHSITSSMVPEPQNWYSFFDAALRWACCHGPIGTVRVLHTRQQYNAPGMDIGRHVSLALALGRGDLALVLLEGSAALSMEISPHLLYQLHHLPPQQVSAVVHAIVAKGYDVNGKVSLMGDKRFVRDRLSVFCDGSGGTRDAQLVDLFRHWMPEIRGTSLTPLRWAIYHGNQHVVKALLGEGAEFARIPSVADCLADVRSELDPPLESFTVSVLDEPCANIDILKLFLARHGSQPGRAVFAETPLGLLVMEPDSPERRLRFAGQGEQLPLPTAGGSNDNTIARPSNMDKVLSLLRRYQRDAEAQLFWAGAMNGHLDVVRYLVRAGVDIESRYQGQTPLHTAVLHGQRDIFDFLVQNGSDARALTTEEGMSAMHLLFWRPKAVETELYMLQELYRLLGNVAGTGGSFGETVHPIHLAVLNSRVGAVTKLMELGADPWRPILKDIMPSLQGCPQNARRMPSIPGENFQYPNQENFQYPDQEEKQTQLSIEGLTPAGIVLARYDMFAVDDVLDLLSILILDCAAPDGGSLSIDMLYTRPEHKQTVFHLLACHYPLMESGIFEDLLDRCELELGLDLVNVRDADGDTPLHYASLFDGSCITRSIDRILAAGGDPASKNRFGMTPSTIRSWAYIWQETETMQDKKVIKANKKLQLGNFNARERPQYIWGCNASRRRLRRVGEAPDDPGVVQMVSELLHGTNTQEAWDVHARRTLRFDQVIRAQIITETDVRANFATRGLPWVCPPEPPPPGFAFPPYGPPRPPPGFAPPPPELPPFGYASPSGYAPPPAYPPPM